MRDLPETSQSCNFFIPPGVTFTPPGVPFTPAGVENLTTARRLNFSPCHALRSPSRLPRMRIRCASSSYLDPSANEPAKPSRALENAADAPPPPLNGTFAHRPRRARHNQFGASRLPRTSYALLRTIQAHRDTPTAANHPRPRRPTDRLCNGQCTSNSYPKTHTSPFSRASRLPRARARPG